jgi:5-methylcytosine-specific restriction endonuclease McrA
MARNRMIKPEFWTDEKSGMFTPFQKCLFLGMLNFSDDEGLIKANPIYLKASVFPYDYEIALDDVKNALALFQEQDMVFLYSHNHQDFAWIIKFKIHQRVDKPQKPQNPAPSIQNGKYKDAIYKRDNYICHICGEFVDLNDKLNNCGSKFPSIDHVVPKSKGGSDYPSNLKTCCISCNKSKGYKIIPGTFQDHSGNGIEQKKRKEEKRRENKEKIKEKTNPPECISLKVWQDFIDHRNSIKKPMTEKAKSLMIARLMEMHEKGHDVNDILENSIINGWQGVFEPRDKNNGTNKPFDKTKNGKNAKKPDYSEYDEGAETFQV